jgi:FMN phosphatase YigB (HAD superfamily)
MYREAADRLNITLSRSYYIGDRIKDVLPALELGGMGILVRTGYGREEEPGVPAGVAVADDLTEAVDLILEARAEVDPSPRET